MDNSIKQVVIDDENITRPCPFCGGTDSYPPRPIKLMVPWAMSETWTVECENCQANCGYESNKKDAIVRWNSPA